MIIWSGNMMHCPLSSGKTWMLLPNSFSTFLMWFFVESFTLNAPCDGIICNSLCSMPLLSMTMLSLPPARNQTNCSTNSVCQSIEFLHLHPCPLLVTLMMAWISSVLTITAPVVVSFSSNNISTGFGESCLNWHSLLVTSVRKSYVLDVDVFIYLM